MMEEEQEEFDEEKSENESKETEIEGQEESIETIDESENKSQEEDENKEDVIENDLDEPQEDIEQEILADLEEIDKEIENLPAVEENEIENDNEQDIIVQDSDEIKEEKKEEGITQESLEEFMQKDESEDSSIEHPISEEDVLEEPVSEEPISAEELESEEVDEHSRRKNIIEGALFVAGRPISIEELNIKTDIKKKDLEEGLKELIMDYLMRSTALEIVQIQDKYSLQIKPEYTPNVKKFATGGLIPDRHLKTLTIIALKQPILKSKLIKIRGSGAYEHVKFLLDRGFISAIKKGRSYELMTTENFADTFGLSRDVPTLKKQLITQLGIKSPANKDEE